MLRACEAEIPPNLTPRLSAAMIDGPPQKGWGWTSTVVSEATEDTCPSSAEGGNCAGHGCSACRDRERKDVPCLKH